MDTKVCTVVDVGQDTIDDVRRLSKEGACVGVVGVLCADAFELGFGNFDSRADQASHFQKGKGPEEASVGHIGQVFLGVELDPHHIGIRDIGPSELFVHSLQNLGLLDGVAEVLVEHPGRDHFAQCGVVLQFQVHIVDAGLSQAGDCL